MIESFHQLEPYALDKQEKEVLLTEELKQLTAYHREKCKKYADFLDAVGYEEGKVKTYADIPFYPVRMFKEHDLMSIGRDEVFKTMTSSGTTGQAVSKIYTDKETAMLQQKVMVRILSDFVGKKRIPILVVDAPSVLKNRDSFSARGAAIIGLRVIAREMTFVLNEDMSLNREVLVQFLEKNGNSPFVIFGFTFMVWQHFYQSILQSGIRYDMSQAVLMTGGGWKKLISEAITTDKFKEAFENLCGIHRFLDHYGMVEQTGCIYAECECGNLHASIYSDVLIRNPKDFSLCKNGEPGLIQVVSVLPKSYPGHSLLTEDEGVVAGEDDCPCGRKGKYIRILGRIKSAELRGCSDTYADKF